MRINIIIIESLAFCCGEAPWSGFTEHTTPGYAQFASLTIVWHGNLDPSVYAHYGRSAEVS